MRRLLIATSALALVATIPARAEMDVTVGGYVDFEVGFVDNDVASNSNRDFQSESEVHVKANGTTEDGLKYGAYMELQTSTSDTVATDEANLYLESGWGRLELGDQDGAGSVLAVQAPDVGIGQVNGSYNDFVPAADRGYRNSESAGDSFIKPLDTADATKVTYYSPKFEGFQAGVSYAPERDDSEDGEQVQFSDNVGNHKDAFELSLKYEGEFGGVGVRASGEYNFAAAKTGSGLEDISAWGLGAALTWQGLSFGGSYFDNGDSAMAAGTANDTVKGYSAGLSYKQDAWGVAASWAQIDFDQAGTPFELTGATGAGGEYTVYGAGATCKLAPGLTAGADLMFFDRNRVTGADTDGYVLVTEVKAAF